MLLRIAVPPPQQKFSRARPSKRGNGGVPRRRHGTGKTASTDGAAGNDPAIGRGGADARILQRRYQLGEPAFREAHVGIGEDDNFEIFGERFHRAAEVMHLLAAILGGACNHNVHGPLAGGLDSLDDFERGIEAGGEREINLVVRVVESGERRQVVFKPRLDTFARANQRRDRCVKSRMRREPSTHETEPFVTVPERVEPQRNLHHDQEIEEIEHFRENSKKRREEGRTHALTC